MVAEWMSHHYFRTFHVLEEKSKIYDAILKQRNFNVGVTIAELWGNDSYTNTSDDYAELLSKELEEDGGYNIWVPPRINIKEHASSNPQLNITLLKGLKHLSPGERREVRVPTSVKLAKLENEGAYVSVSGGLSNEWTTISEGIQGSYHLDSRDIYRTPDENAELDVILSQIRDKAKLLEVEEITIIEVHDYWVVSRLQDTAPSGISVISSPPQIDPIDGSPIRRELRQEIARASKQATAEFTDMSVLVLLTSVTHMKDELFTTSLKSMNPQLYGNLDLILLVADGTVRQILKPRSLPWE